MKPWIFTIWAKTAGCIVLGAMFLASCTNKETFLSNNGYDEYEKGVPASITFTATTLSDDAITRETFSGDGIDRTMNTLRLLIFNYVPSSTPNSAEQCTLVKNLFFEDPTAKNIKIDIPTGEYHFLFVANEDSAPELKAKLIEDDPDGAVGDLHKLVDMSVTAAAINDTMPIPMVSHYPWVEVSGTNQVQYSDPFNMGGRPGKGPGSSPKWVPETGIWPVRLERLAIRLEITLTLSEKQFLAWANQEISISNIPGSVLIKQQENNDEATRTMREYVANDTGEGVDEKGNRITGKIFPPGDPDNSTADKWQIKFPRIILPEKAFGDTQHGGGGGSGTVKPHDASKAFTFSLFLGDKQLTGLIVLPGDLDGDGLPSDGDELPFVNLGHTIVRNTYFCMGVKVGDDWNTLHITSRALPWNEINMGFSGGVWELTVDRDVLHFPVGGGKQEFEVFATHSDGWELIDDDPDNNYTDMGITVLPRSGDSNEHTPVTVTVAASPGTSPRESWFFIRAGNMLKLIKVMQEEAPLPDVNINAPSAYYMLDGREVTIAFNSNVPWTAELGGDQSIIATTGSTLSGDAGNGVLKFTLIADNSNTQNTDRAFTITFAGAFGTKTVTIIGRTPYLRLGQNTYTVPGILPTHFDIGIISNIPGLVGVTASVTDNANGVITGASVVGQSLRTDVTIAQTAARTGQVKINWSSNSLLLEDAVSVSRIATDQSFTYVDGLWLSPWVKITAGEIEALTENNKVDYVCPTGSTIWTSDESESSARRSGTPTNEQVVDITYATRTPFSPFVNMYNYRGTDPAGILFNVLIPGPNVTFLPGWEFSYRCVARQ